MVNRKLVRPNLSELKEKLASPRGGNGLAQGQPAGGRESHRESGSHAPRRRPAPPDGTAAEAFYYLKQMNAKTPMVVVLEGGERLHGHIEWYDRNCIKVHRTDGPNLLVYKHAVRYMYKQEDETPAAGDRN